MASVYVVDDNEDGCRTMARILRLLGHGVATFPHGRAFLDATEDPARPLPDLVILDYMMPEMDGLTALAKFRANPRTARVVVAMFTAYDGDGLATRCLAAGANTFWVKGAMDLHALQRSIQQLLAERPPGGSLTDARGASLPQCHASRACR